MGILISPFAREGRPEAELLKGFRGKWLVEGTHLSLSVLATFSGSLFFE